MQHTHPAHPSVAERNTPRGGVLRSPGQRLRAIVKKAVDQRRFLLQTGRSHMAHEQVSMPMMRLHLWLQRNPWPSEATVKAFPHEAEVQLVLPGTRGSATLLDELHKLIQA
jgi:hypothetical protein